MKYCVCNICSCFVGTHVRPFFKERSVFTVFDLYANCVLTLLKENMSSFSLKFDQHGHNTRTCSGFGCPSLPACQKTERILFPCNQGLQFVAGKCPKPSEVFKKVIKTSLLSRPLHSIDELYGDPLINTCPPKIINSIV